MIASVRDLDHGYKALRQRLTKLRGSYTKVGFLAGSKHDSPEGPVSLVEMAAVHEFGSADGGIPSRSFLRSTYSEQRDKLDRIMDRESIAVLAGHKTPEESLRQVGEYFQSEVQTKIGSNIPPPNAPETVARKGSSRTLVDSGQMMQSVRHVEVIK